MSATDKDAALDWLRENDPDATTPGYGDREEIARLRSEALANDPRGTSMRFANLSLEEQDRIVTDAAETRRNLAEQDRRVGRPLTDEEAAQLDEIDAVSELRRAESDDHPDRHHLDDRRDDHQPGALRFYSPRQLAALTTSEPEWVVRPGLLAIGAITEIDGKIKSAGKTTLVLHMIRAALDGADFLGQTTRRVRVVFVTEQSRQTFAHALRLVGLDDRGDELLILFREDLHGTPWPQVVAACRRDGYGVVVFDTIGKLAGIREENSAGEWALAMSPVQDLAASGRAIIVNRHDRKGGGDVGDSGRGSSQASGDVDIILALRRPEGRQSSNRRVIESLSRFRETPDKIVVELTPAGYILLGTDEAVAVSDARSCLLTALGSEYRQTGKGLSMAALVQLGEEQVPKVKRWAIQGALASLIAERRVLRTGAGKAGDPYIYAPVTGDEGLSGETQTFRSADNSSNASERYQRESAA